MFQANVPAAYTSEADKALLAAMEAAGNATPGMNCRLYKDGLGPSPATPLADFVAAECDFVGYAAVPLTWSAEGLGSDAFWHYVSNRAFFSNTDGTAPQNAGGVFITWGAGPAMWAYFQLPQPVQFTVPLSFAAVTVSLGFSGETDVDVEC